ncbi:MAG: hypothetical protein EOP49_20080 [Sphingobacteriales bacterium]|nr:MAG: hypothetical protein EOP49_20080 [Sphingobacteriales bacterium]
MTKFITQLTIALSLAITPGFAQTSDSIHTENLNDASVPIPVEIFGGNKAFNFQLIVSKQFTSQSRFGFFNVTNFTGNYKTIEQANDFFSQSLLTGEIWKGISLTAGLSAIGSSTTSISVRPTAGLQYLLANRDFVIVVLPRFDLTQTFNFETFSVFEYKPMLSKYWGFYSRLQALYNYNIQLSFHEVSSIYLRLGLSYKNLQFGVGANFDFYGPDYKDRKNFGVFIKTDLF